MYDGTAPYFTAAVLDEEGSRFLLSNTWGEGTPRYLCTYVPTVRDDESDLTAVRLDLIEQVGNSISQIGESLELDLQATAAGTTVCRNVSLQHGQRYYSRVTAFNGAVPALSSQSRAISFVTDDTPPSIGSVTLKVLFPDNFEQQTSFTATPPALSDLVVRVKMSGFYDDESNVAAYRVTLISDEAGSGGSIEGGSGDDGTVTLAETTLDWGVASYDIASLPLLANGTILTAVVVAINGAGLETAATNAQKTLTIDEIQLDDPWMANDYGEALIGPYITDDAISIGFKRATDPLNAGAWFEYNWFVGAGTCDDGNDVQESRRLAAIVDEASSGDISSGDAGSGDAGYDERGSGDSGFFEDEAGAGSGEVASGEIASGEIASGETASGEIASGDSLTEVSYESQLIAVPVQQGVILWGNEVRQNETSLSLDPCTNFNDLLLSSTTIWSASFSSQRLADGEYCVLITACSRAEYAQDGSLELYSRCQNAASASKILDTSEPEATCDGLMSVNSSAVELFPMQVPFSCSDEQSGIETIILSIGTHEDPGLFLSDLLLNVTTDINGTEAHHSGNVSGLDGIYATTSNSTAFSGVAILLEAFFANASQFDSILISLTCVNPLGMLSIARAYYAGGNGVVDVQVPVVGEISLGGYVWSERHLSWLGSRAIGDPTLDGVILYWDPFSDVHVSLYSICVSIMAVPGCSATLDIDAASTTGLFNVTLPASAFAINTTNTSTIYSITLKATDAVGKSSSSDVHLLYDHSVPAIGQLSASIFEHAAGAVVSDSHASNTTILTDTIVRLELAGQAYDNDIDEDLSLQWVAYATGGAPLTCIFERMYGTAYANTSWIFTANCSVIVAGELCFNLSAVSVVGLASVSSTCIAVHLAAPVWSQTAEPILARVPDADGNASRQLNVFFSYPAYLLDGITPTLTYKLCTHLGCDASEAQGGQTQALFSLEHPLFEGYTGETWVEFHTAYPSYSKGNNSNRIRVGSEEPTQGVLTLSSHVASLSEAELKIDGFVETVMGVSSLVWCVGTTVGASDLMACRTETTLEFKRPAILRFAAFSDSLVFLDYTHYASVTATACNSLGQCTQASSNSIVVDLDQPTGGFIADGLILATDSVWDEVNVLTCKDDSSLHGSGLACVTYSLLNGDESDALRQFTIAALTTHVLSATNTGVVSRDSSLLSVSWGGFVDNSTGLAESMELCFLQVATSDEESSGDTGLDEEGSGEGSGEESGGFSEVATDTTLACVKVGTQGFAMASIATVEEGRQYYVTIKASDRAGNSLILQSAGVQILTSAPASADVSIVSGQQGARQRYTQVCTQLQVEFWPFDDPGCEASPSYAWTLCDARGNCSASMSLIDSSLSSTGLYQFNTSVSLETGVTYRTAVSATSACSGATTKSESVGLLCDETSPDIRGSPTLELVGIYGDPSYTWPPSNASGTNGARLRWTDLLVDAESSIAGYEVCITLGGMHREASTHHRDASSSKLAQSHANARIMSQAPHARVCGRTPDFPRRMRSHFPMLIPMYLPSGLCCGSPTTLATSQRPCRTRSVSTTTCPC